MGGVLSFGLSKSSSTSVQEAEAAITQRYQGTCNIRCNNAISDVNLILIGTEVKGDIAVSQECSLDAQCLFNNTMDAVSDVAFAATNSSNAKNAASGVLSMNFDFSTSQSRQSVNQYVNQTVSNACDLSSTNTLNRVNLFAADSNIGGNILFAQSGETNGECVFESLMNAAVYASATAQNTAESGKEKKGGSLATIASVVGVVVLLVVFGVVASRLAKKKCPKNTRKQACKPGKTVSDGSICGDEGFFCKPTQKAAQAATAKKKKQAGTRAELPPESTPTRSPIQRGKSVIREE